MRVQRSDTERKRLELYFSLTCSLSVSAHGDENRVSASTRAWLRASPSLCTSLEGPTRKPRHASVLSTHSDTQVVAAFECIRISTSMRVFSATGKTAKNCQKGQISLRPRLHQPRQKLSDNVPEGHHLRDTTRGLCGGLSEVSTGASAGVRRIF